MLSLFKMAESITTPAGRTSQVWKHFGFKEGEKDGKKVTCKLCGVYVAHGGGSTNLKTHLRTWHRSTHDELFKVCSTDVSPGKQETIDTYVTRVTKLPHHSERARKLTNCISEMIARDIQPISIVDDVGFLNLLREAEPRYVVPCRSTISRCIDDLYVSHKEEFEV